MAKQVFVSFCSRDQILVAELMARLRAQPLAIWDYSHEGSEIPGMTHVAEYLRQRIAGSEVFIPVVTDAYVRSEYTAIEVRQAMEMERAGAMRVLPLVVRPLSFQGRWPDPYEELRDIRYHELTVDDQAAMEIVVQRICRDLGIAYSALPIQSPRLPFMDRFVREFEERIPRDAEHLRALYCRLQEAAAAFTTAFAQRRYDAALKSITYFISMCEYEYTGERFYYPYVVQAVCLMSMGRWAEASETLHRLLNHPLLEENALGALARVKEAQGHFDEALGLWQQALQRSPKDEGAAAGIVVNSLLLRRRLPSETVLSVIENGRFVSPEERHRASMVRASGLAMLGRSREAAALFADLAGQGALRDADIVNYANVLKDLGRGSQVRDLLRQGLEREPDNPLLLRWLGRYYLEEGPREEALPCCRRIVELSGGSLESLYEYLLVQVEVGDPQARATAERLINAGMPANRTESYYVGYANWILNRRERAEYDFERSGFAASDHYRHARQPERLKP